MFKLFSCPEMQPDLVCKGLSDTVSENHPIIQNSPIQNSLCIPHHSLSIALHL